MKLGGPAKEALSKMKLQVVQTGAALLLPNFCATSNDKKTAKYATRPMRIGYLLGNLVP
jgi:hypothetical protein